MTNEIAKVSGQGAVSMAISASVNFVQGKERAGQERALGAGGLVAGRFERAAYSRLLGLIAILLALIAAGIFVSLIYV